jgi:hypothetical protein
VDRVALFFATGVRFASRGIVIDRLTKMPAREDDSR